MLREFATFTQFTIMNSITLEVTMKIEGQLDDGMFRAGFEMCDSPQTPLSREHNLFFAAVLERALKHMIS